MPTPTLVAKCCALTTMPFSAATGLMEAASAVETATSDQMQAIGTTTRNGMAMREIRLHATDLFLLIQYLFAPAPTGPKVPDLPFGEVISECFPGVALPS